MSERSPLTPDPVADALARFTPVGVDRDELMFRAGQAAARPPRGWKVATGLLAVSQAVTLGFLLARGPAPAPAASAAAPTAPVSVEVPPAAPDPFPEVAPPPRPAPKPWRDPPAADPDGYDRPPAVAGGGRFLPYSYGALLSGAADRTLPPARSQTGPDLPPISVRSWERVRVGE